MKSIGSGWAAVGLISLTILGAASACTGITIKPKDGSIVFARTLEFATDLQSNVLILPRGTEFVGTAAKSQPGLRWKSRYGVVGANAFGLKVTIDGINEKGLHVGLFYFPGFAKYQEVPTGEVGRSLAPWELGVYLLGTCADAAEAVAEIKKVLVGEVVQKDMGIVPPVHYIVTDARGESRVIEYVEGQLKIHANPLGVMSNAPQFDWHMTNLSNYVNLSAKNVERKDLAGKEIRSLGQGSGMLGLPGDFTPPSRFVRAVAFTQSAVAVDTAREGVLQAFHLLNQFNIPKGAARGTEQGQEVADFTLWTTVADLKNLRYHFRTFDNSRIRMVDLKQCELAGPEIRSISMKGAEPIEDVTGQAK